MPRNWNAMTQEEKDAYNLLRRQKYKDMSREDKGDQLQKFKDYHHETRKPNYKAAWKDLSEQEAIDRFFYGYTRWYERIVNDVKTHPPVFKPEAVSIKGREKVLNWNFENEKRTSWRRYVKNTNRFNAPDRGSVDKAVEGAAKRYVRNVCKWLSIYAHHAKFGPYRPGPNTAQEFAKCELWHKILLTLGRNCSICHEPLPFDYACRPVLKNDPMHIIPNKVWALEDMWKNVYEHEIICFKCHFDMRIEMTQWLWTPNCPRFASANRVEARTNWKPRAGLEEAAERWRSLYPSNTEELRRLKPKWLVTSEIRDGKPYSPFFVRRTDSHVYWRSQPRTMTPVHETQSIFFYQQLYPSVNTNSWGLGRAAAYCPQIHCEALLSKDLRDFYRNTPPPGCSPLSEEECEKIYENSFNGMVQKGVLWY